MLPQLPGARWIAWLRTEIDCWPTDTVLPRGARELASRAAGTARVLRARLPATSAAPADRNVVTEIIAVPSADCARACSVADGGVAVIGLHGDEAGDRADTVRRVRAVLDAGAPPAKVRPERAVLDGASEGSGRRGDLARAVLEAAGTHGDVLACALAVADASATFGGCARVSVGVQRRGKARLLAVSGESAPDRRREPVRRLENAMGEALAADEAVQEVPADVADGWADDERRRDEDGLDAPRASETAASAWSCVHEAPGGVRVVAVLEHASGRAPNRAARQAMADAIAPALGLVGVLERGGGRRMPFVLRGAANGSTGPGGARADRRRRVLAVAVLLPILYAAVAVPMPYRVSARVAIEASDRQVLAAPHAGHLGSAHARAGDTVVAGQLLATLDEREMALATEKWLGEQARNGAEQAMALSARDRVELARLRADAARIEVERSLAEQRRARGEIRAPFDGVVLSGDPTRLLGAPLEAGQTLFEVASGEQTSLLVEIDEHDVALVEAGALARVRMAAAPRDVIEATLGAIVPVAVAEPGGSVFRVRAALLDKADGEALRPGMQGVARIDAGRRSLVDAWTRAVRERLVLYGWKLGLLR